MALTDGTRVSADHEILTRRNDRRLTITTTDWVKNGDRFTVQHVLPGGALRAAYPATGRRVVLPAAYVAEHAQHGYASTVHTAQGRTADTSHTVLTGAEDRQLLYVAATRGRTSNSLYLQTAGDGDEHAPPSRTASGHRPPVSCSPGSRAATGAASPGLLLMLDECGTAAPLRHLPALSATGRGQGIQLVSVFQDRGQIEQRYGRLADSVLTNHRAKLALSGIADLDTLDYFSKLLGDTDVDRHSVTNSTTGRSTSTSQQRERLAPADALRQLPLGAGLLVYGSLPPARVRFPLPARRVGARNG